MANPWEEFQTAPAQGPWAEFAAPAATPAAAPPKQPFTLADTWPARLAKAVWSGVTLPRDVLMGQVDPLSDEGIGRAANLAGVPALGMTGGVPLISTARIAAAKPPPAGLQAAQAAADLGVTLPRAAEAAPEFSRALSNVPFMGNPLVRAAEKATTELGERAGGLTAELGAGSPAVAGEAAKSAIKNWIETTSRQMEAGPHTAVRNMVDPTVGIPLTATRRVAEDIAASNAAAGLPAGKAVGQVMPSIRAPTPTFEMRGLEGAGMTAQQPRPSLPYEAIKDLRSTIGEQVGQSILPEGLRRGELKQIYGALSKDLEDSIYVSGGLPAVEAWKAATAQSRLLSAQRNALSKIVGKTGDVAPEAVFSRIAAMAGSNSRADMQKLMLAKRTMSEDAWNEIASGVVSNLGRGTEGQFDPSKFLANYSKLSENGRSALFSPEHQKALSNMATVAESVEKMSRFGEGTRTGTTQLLTAGGGAGGLVWLGITSALPAAATAAGSAIAGRITAQVLARPTSAKALANWTQAYERSIRNPSASSQALLRTAERNLGETLQGLPLIQRAPAEGEGAGDNPNRLRINVP